MKLQIQDLNGQAIKETEITLGENDTLVMTYDMEKIDFEIAEAAFNFVKEGLENNDNLVAVPLGVEFKIIKKQ